MKKLLLAVATFAIGFCPPCWAQTETESEYQAYLERSKERMVKKQRLIDAQHGHHFGAAYSNTLLLGIDDGGMKNGILLFYGNRLSEYWMLSAMIGADALTPAKVSYWDNQTNELTTIDRPLMSFPVMGEVKFYFGTSRFMPYLFADIGASISKYTSVIFNTGVGADINFKDSHTIFLQLGLGVTPVPTINDNLGLTDNEQTLQKGGKFAMNIRLGYYF